jgi:hypothetical protein
MNLTKSVHFLYTFMGQNENVILEIEDTTGVLRICKSKNRQHNGQKKKDKQPEKPI